MYFFMTKKEMEYLATMMYFVVKYAYRADANAPPGKPQVFGDSARHILREVSAMCDNGSIFEEELNPKFLFTWKATRDEKTYTLHSHDFCEIGFVMSGRGKYRIDEALYEVSEGDLLVLNPGVRHQVLLIEGNENPSTEFFVAATDFQLKDMERNCLPLPDGQPILHTSGELRQRVFRICSSIESENAVFRQGRYYMMKAYMIQLLLLIIREQYDPVERKGGYAFESVNKKYVVEQILNYFEDHYKEKISLDQIASNMYLSPFYISRIFKSETGEAPIRHLINIRLEKAYELLEKGWNGSIQEAAACVGYDDAYHFSKLFKKRYGVSPSQVKKG